MTRKPAQNPLTLREIKFVKAKVQGKSNIQAALEATGTTNANAAHVKANRMLRKVTVRNAIEESLIKHGITMDAAIAPIADALQASKSVLVGTGEDAYVDQAPDHSNRLKASGMALELMGARNKDGQTVNITFNAVAQDERSEFGI